MINESYTRELYNTHQKHTTFGGIICQSDFDTRHCNGDTVKRILSAWAFDKQCAKNAEQRDKTRNKKKKK